MKNPNDGVIEETPPLEAPEEPVATTEPAAAPEEPTAVTEEPVEATAETPVEEAAATEEPVEETTTETPVEEATTAETPVEEAAATEEPVEKTTTTETPVEEAAKIDAPKAPYSVGSPLRDAAYGYLGIDGEQVELKNAEVSEKEKRIEELLTETNAYFQSAEGAEGIAHFGKGETEKAITIRPIDNAEPSGTRVFLMALMGVAEGQRGLIAPDSNSYVSLLDDEEREPTAYELSARRPRLVIADADGQSLKTAAGAVPLPPRQSNERRQTKCLTRTKRRSPSRRRTPRKSCPLTIWT